MDNHWKAGKRIQDGMMKSKKGMPMATLIAVLITLGILLGVILPMLLPEVKKGLNITAEMEIQGAIKEGEEQQYAQDPKNLIIMKVVDVYGLKIIPRTPTGWDPDDWEASTQKINNQYKRIIIYFDKKINMGEIPKSYYDVYTNSDRTGTPSQRKSWYPPKGSSADQFDLKFVPYGKLPTDKFISGELHREKWGTYYIIRFKTEEEYEDENGNEWTLSPLTATIKFEID